MTTLIFTTDSSAMSYWLENRRSIPDNLDGARIVRERVAASSRTQEQAIAIAQERANASGVQQVVFFSWKSGMYSVTELHAWVKPGDYGLNPDSIWDDCYDEVIVSPKIETSETPTMKNLNLAILSCSPTQADTAIALIEYWMESSHYPTSINFPGLEAAIAIVEGLSEEELTEFTDYHPLDLIWEAKEILKIAKERYSD